MPLDDYHIIKKVGTGKYAAVYEVKRTTDGKMFALKRVQLQQGQPKVKNNALNQAKLLQALKHPHIVNLEEVCLDEYSQQLCLILELGLCDLSSKINAQNQPLSEQFVWNILGQISEGLEYLHASNILHRDIKTTNIMMFEGDIAKIGDLNVSTTIQNLNYTRTGTLSYASPEIWKGQVYDFKSDIWSLGCLVYEMVTRRRPFEGEDIEQISKKIMKCQYPKITAHYSKELKDLISFMIQLNPRLRPSAKTIAKICSNKTKSKKEKKNTKLEALEPFFQRSLTDPGLQACLEHLRSFDVQNPKEKERQRGKTVRRGRTLKHEEEEKRPEKELRKQLQRQTYKRIIVHKPEHFVNDSGDEDAQLMTRSSNHMKIWPRRLDKMPIYQRKRRNTQL